MEEKVFDLEVEVVFEIYPNVEQGFYIYSLKPVDLDPSIRLELDFKGTFVAKGYIPRLNVGERHKVKIEEVYDKTYGKQYEFLNIQLRMPQTVEEQQDYVQGLVTEKQFESILEAYPKEKILDLILEGGFDHTKVNGFGEHTLKKVRQRLSEYLELYEAMSKLDGLGITLNSLQRLVNHFGSPSQVVSAIDENIYNLCKVSGFGFKTVDEYALNRGDDPNSDYRILACITYILGEEENQGHVWASTTLVMNEGVELLAIERETIENCIKKIDNQGDLILEEGHLFLHRNFLYETEVFNMLLELNSVKPKSFDVNLMKERVKKIEESNGFGFNEEQHLAIYEALTHNVFVLNGKAGSGKSSTVRGIVEALGHPHYTAVALSGSAAKVLRNEGLKAATIHKTLGVTGEGGFEHNEKNRLPHSVIIADESSMVNSFLFFSLLKAMREGSKLIVVGDSGQLPAIGAGAVFDNMIKSDYFAQRELIQVHRQASASGILSTANKIREGKQINGYMNYNTQRLGENKDLTLIPHPNADHIVDTLMDICAGYDGKIEDFQVITGRASNSPLSVAELNPKLQKLFNRNANSHTSLRLTLGKTTYYIGDKIIHNGNNYKAGENEDISILNGTTGVVLDIREKHKDIDPYLTIQFDGIDTPIEYGLDELKQVSLAYAITVHKGQGASIPYVIFAFDYTSYTFLNREFVYTGLTRASKGCVMIVDNRALYTAIKNIGNSRRTLLLDKLLQEKDKKNI